MIPLPHATKDLAAMQGDEETSFLLALYIWFGAVSHLQCLSERFMLHIC